MKYKKMIGICMTVIVGSSILFGCSNSRAEDVSGVMKNEDAQRLPEDQKDTELDKTLAKLRKVRKEGLKIENGSMTATGPSSLAIPGAPENEPERSQSELEEIYEEVRNYVIEKLNIDSKDKEKINYLDISNCIDPRMTGIYDDKDKGVAKGYENKDIYIAEYEKSENKYMYVIFVRDSKTKKWIPLKEGLTYKE